MSIKKTIAYSVQ